MIFRILQIFHQAVNSRTFLVVPFQLLSDYLLISMVIICAIAIKFTLYLCNTCETLIKIFQLQDNTHVIASNHIYERTVKWSWNFVMFSVNASLGNFSNFPDWAACWPWPLAWSACVCCVRNVETSSQVGHPAGVSNSQSAWEHFCCGGGAIVIKGCFVTGFVSYSMLDFTSQRTSTGLEPISSGKK